MVKAEVRKRLEEIVGEEGVALGLLGAASGDGPRLNGAISPRANHPSAAGGEGSNPASLSGGGREKAPGCEEVVVKPKNVEDVRKVVQVARDEGIGVTARGGGTGLWGGAEPAPGGIVVSCEDLAGEPEIHRDDLYVVVGPGMVTGRLRAHLAERGLFYPVDPASEAASTIGGNVGEGADGLRSLKYGTTRNYVLGLELVTPQAEMVRVGAKTVKNVAGYDLTRLMVGSEGTLAIATSVTLRVLPLPPDEVVMAFGFEDGVRAAEAAYGVLAGGANPSLLEVMESGCLKALGRHPWSSLGGLLLVGFDGSRSRCESEAAKVTAALNAKGGAAAAPQAWRPGAETLLEPRRRALAALVDGGQAVLLEDLAVAPVRVGEVVARISEISRKRGVRAAVWGHAGRGSIHVAVPADPGETAAGPADAVISEVAEACDGLGGTAYGPVGVGTARTARPRIATSAVGRDVLADLKHAMDPKGIMNPGKMTYEA